MAAMNDFACYYVENGVSRPGGEPSVGVKREASATIGTAASALCVDDSGLAVADRMTKKKKHHHASNEPSSFPLESKQVTVVRCDERPLSPTDVRTAYTASAIAIGRCDTPSEIRASSFSVIKTLPPTVGGIADAARVLHASKSSPVGGGEENQASLLLSFPTESVYMLACCVKTATSRSIRKLLSPRIQSPTSTSCSSSFPHQDPAINGGIPLIKDFIHPSNPSLEWMLQCNDGRSMAPALFVLDGHHALNFCHFTKPKTFCIRPPSLPANSNCANNALAPTPLTFGPLADVAIVAAPDSHKLRAANFSESREAFLRLASKFWPGPVTILVRARALGEEDGASPDVLGDAAGATALPESVLVPGGAGYGNLVGMRCPSHPLPRRILNKIYRRPGSSRTSNDSDVSRSSSSGSLASVSSADDVAAQRRTPARRNGRIRSGIAVVGCVAPGPDSPVDGGDAGASTAADVGRAMAVPGGGDRSRQIFIVDGEERRESFSVPTCQHGAPPPASLVVDGENRTVHLVHGRRREGTLLTLTKGSVLRALRKPASSGNERSSIDRVVTAVLSRWQILETVEG